MKKIILIVCSSFIMAFAGKCGLYRDDFAKLALLSGNVAESLYPMGTLCFLEPLDSIMNFKEFPWEKVRKNAAADGKEFPTERGGQLLYDMLQASEIVVEEIIRSGKFSPSYRHGQVIGCYLTDEMLKAIGSETWGNFRANFVVNLGYDFFSDNFIFVFLDKRTCKAWGSRQVTKEDLKKNRKNRPF